MNPMAFVIRAATYACTPLSYAGIGYGAGIRAVYRLHDLQFEDPIDVLCSSGENSHYIPSLLRLGLAMVHNNLPRE